MTLRGKALCWIAAALPSLWIVFHNLYNSRGLRSEADVGFFFYLFPSFAVRTVLFGSAERIGAIDLFLCGLLYTALFYLLISSVVRECLRKDS